MRSLDFYGRKAIRNDDDILICAGDVETANLGGRLLSIQWANFSGVHVDTSVDMVDNFFHDFLDTPYPAVWFFHFGQYDWRYFLSYIEETQLDVQIRMRTETDIYEIRVKRKDEKQWSVMRDSYALWPHKLEDLAKSFCPEIPKLKIEIEHFDPENPEHLEYAKRDVEILMLGLPRLFQMLNHHFDVNPTATTAGTAMKAWQKSLPFEVSYPSQTYNEAEVFIRQAYYGGLVFLTSNQSFENCVTYDRNSSYPAAMCEFGVPIGAPIYTTEFIPEYIGFYSVRIKSPIGLIVPIIPSRNEKGMMQWRQGEFDTVVSSIELVFAIKHGYEILDVYEGYYFTDVDFPFNDFIDHCKLIRKTFKGKPEEILAKLMQNSLYGKFGSRRDRYQLVHHDDPNIEDHTILKPVDETGLWYSYKELDEDMRCLPQWAAWITANARLALLKEVYEVGPENALYGDTDSITLKPCHHSKINVGSEYGQWKLEKEWKVFRAIAPKVYAGILKDGTYKGAAKGLPKKHLTQNHWSDILEKGETEAHVMSVASLRIAMKKGVQPAQKLLRKSSTLNNSQNFTGSQNGDIRVKYSHG